MSDNDKKQPQDQQIILRNVRLSFPALFQPEKFNGVLGKFAGTFLLDKSDKATYNKIVKQIEAALAEARIKVPKDKWFIKDGDDSAYDGYEGNWSIKASSRTRPTLIDADKTQLEESDGRLYAGCYVNAIISMWIQNNKEYGKRVNANVLGVQFVKDGEPFAAGVTASVDDFDDVSTPNPFKDESKSKSKPKGRVNSAPFDDDEDL